MKLFCFNEYVKDMYQTNKEKHFELILQSNSFNVASHGAPLTLDKHTSLEMKTLRRTNRTAILEVPDGNYHIFDKSFELLGLRNKSPETLETYKDIITNGPKLNKHLSIIRLLTSNEYVDNKLNAVADDGCELKTQQNTTTSSCCEASTTHTAFNHGT